ncbi:unnamed protein product [Zymoseptoria tritici ST99CH_1A5]|uniref:Uncharacterized protein n=1 Tax=Zymoseptoria tritici ST99CH_1A5 TaxID=1276529 RepID=A0A1Y6M468_ZYMTR|nr:unnamed protein product [Zymoseptoria tritici ST99CH_1A5]
MERTQHAQASPLKDPYGTNNMSGPYLSSAYVERWADGVFCLAVVDVFDGDTSPLLLEDFPRPPTADPGNVHAPRKTSRVQPSPLRAPRMTDPTVPVPPSDPTPSSAPTPSANRRHRHQQREPSHPTPPMSIPVPRPIYPPQITTTHDCERCESRAPYGGCDRDRSTEVARVSYAPAGSTGRPSQFWPTCELVMTEVTPGPAGRQ